MEKIKLVLLIDDLQKSIGPFQRSLQIDINKYDEIEKDLFKNGQIQKFEYTVELLWKTLKEFFKINFAIDLNSPLENLKEFLRRGLIDEHDYNVLYDAVKSRNLLSHVYKLEMFDLVYPKLESYFVAINKAYDALKLYTV